MFVYIKRIMFSIMGAVAFSQLQGCAAPLAPVEVYRAAPTIEKQKSLRTIVNVPYDDFIFKSGIELNSKIHALAYPVRLDVSPQGEWFTMLQPVFESSREGRWDLFKGYSDSGTEALLQGIDKENLGQNDITIFEFKIVGLGNHKETVAVKQFKGPVRLFNWVELFEGRVPEDDMGYLMTVNVALNYLIKLEKDKHSKDYFVHMPVLYEKSTRNKYTVFSRKDGSSGLSIGYSSNALIAEPLLKREYETRVPFVKFSYYTKDFPETKKSDDSFDYSLDIDGENNINFYANYNLRLSGKNYKNFFYLNPLFLKRHNILQNAQAMSELQDKRARKEALYSVYRNEQALEATLHELADARWTLYILKSRCKHFARYARSAAKWQSVSGTRNKDSYYKRRSESEIIDNYLTRNRNNLNNAIRQVATWAATAEGLNVQPETIKTYNEAVKFNLLALDLADEQCSDFRSATSSLGSVASSSTRSSLSLFGEVLAKKLGSSYSPGYSPGSGYEPGSFESFNNSWKQFNKNLSAMYTASLTYESAKRSQVQKSYNEKLSQSKSRQQTQKSNSGKSHSSGYSRYSNHTKSTLSLSSKNKAKSSSVVSASTSNGNGRITLAEGACNTSNLPRYKTPGYSAEGNNAERDVSSKTNAYIKQMCGDRGTLSSPVFNVKCTYIKTAGTQQCVSAPVPFTCGCAKRGSGTSGRSVSK